MDERNLIDSAALDALGSMSTIDVPLSPEVLLVDIEIDSLDLVELMQILEDEWKIHIFVGAFKDVTSVGDVLAVIRRHIA